MVFLSATPPAELRPIGDPSRLAAISQLELTAQLGDLRLDAVTRTLAVACRVPIAVLNIVTPGLQTYPSEVGVGQGCTTVPDDLSFCAEVVQTGRLLHIEDATTHSRYRANPRVLAGAVRAYAGHPIRHAGHVVGALSLFDDQCRRFDAADLEILVHQSRLVEAILSLRATSAWDTLTGLAGRALLFDRIDLAIARTPDHLRLAGVAVLDVCGMADINLLHGSAAGDEVLRAVAQRLAAVLRDRDSVARLDGDAFAAVFDDLASVEEARARAAELVDAARGPITVDGRDVPIELSCGVATTPAAGPDALLAAAEHAASLRSGHVAGEQRPYTAIEATTRALRRGLENDEFVLHYQPVVELASGRVMGVEALVRWQHPELGLLSPSRFIRDAEQTGIILPLGTAILRAAAQQLATWHHGGRDLTVSVNLSPKQLAQPGFEQVVSDILAVTGAPPDRLLLEITESSVMDEASAPPMLDKLRALGLRLALDDFGTGYSSFSYLRRFPVDTIKIDRSFVAGLGRHADDDAIVASVVSLAHQVDKTVIAEGVAVEAQAEALRRLGVPLGQGFLWAPALPLAELETWMATHRERQVAVASVTDLTERPPGELRLAVPGSVEERIWRLHTEGASLHTIAAALNADDLRTERGVRWHTASVAKVIAAWSRGLQASRS